MPVRHATRHRVRSIGRGIDSMERRSLVDHDVEQSLINGSVALSGLMAISSDAAAVPAATAGLLDELFQDHPAVSSFPPVVRTHAVQSVDNRFFHPGFRGYPTKGRPGHKLAASSSRKHSFLPHGISLEQKSWVEMCIRRRARRGTILALGQGGGYHRKPRRSPSSDIWC